MHRYVPPFLALTPTLAAARTYAAKKGIHATLIPTPPKTLKLQAYADNFR